MFSGRDMKYFLLNYCSFPFLYTNKSDRQSRDQYNIETSDTQSSHNLNFIKKDKKTEEQFGKF